MATMKTRLDAEARSIAEQAAEWLLILEDGSQEDRAAFAEWLARSPLHVGAFLRASAVDSLLGEIDRERSIEVETGPFGDEGLDIAPPIGAGVGRLKKRAGFRVFGVMRWAIAACATLIVLGLGALLWIQSSSTDAWRHYVTAVGEQRAIDLEDGSVMFLGPDSKVDVRFAADERQLRLESGQAVFRVHHDVSRPFRVHSGQTVVQAVGTEFDVHRTRGESVVSVIEGVVQVTHERTLMQALAAPLSTKAELQPVRLTAGQEIRVAGDGKAAAPAPAPVDHLQAWKERRLTFINETLFTIADEFNRYNRAPKIRVEDAVAGEQRYAAAFDADDPESLVVVLEKDPKLQIERRADQIVIRAR